MNKLIREDIERQDFVDNEIYELINQLNPTSKNIEWNIENIARIRDLLKEVYVDEMNICTEFEFYPFIKI